MPPHVPQSTYNALIRRSIDLRRLYRRAATSSEPGLRLVLGENVQTLDLLIADLQAQLRSSGAGPCASGSWRGAARRRATGWLVRLAARRDSVWIRALAHHESALLHAFEQAIAEAPAQSALVLRRQLPRLHGIHLDMHSLSGTAHY
jgi:uncharacterized protein (TIGR02284 family)